MKWLYALMTVSLLVAGCGEFPRDTEGTLQSIRQRGSFRVGAIAGSRELDRGGRMFLSNIARASNAEPHVITGSGEVLLRELEEGQLDLVVGTMTEKSPWRAKVHFLPPLTSTKPQADYALTVMTRNGENAWTDLLHRELERMARQP